MWQTIRNRGFLGLKFRRQYDMGRFILDVVVWSRRFVVCDVTRRPPGDPAWMRHELSLKELSRELRRHQTVAEIAMWQTIRNRGLLGLKFRRQYEIGRFILDFYCEELQLAIEMDGAPHLDLGVAELDARRTEWLQRCGVTVLRVENEEYLANGTIVLERIRRVVEALRELRRNSPPTRDPHP